MNRLCTRIATTFGILLAAAPTSCAQAQDGTPFFKSKTIRIVMSVPGGGYAEYARLLARHMGNHIAGKPDFVVQGMPGAGGLFATNYLYAQAPKDGTTIGLVNPMAPLAPLFGSKGARFDPLKFNWLGSMDRAYGLCVVWSASPVKSWNDMLDKPLIVGSTGAGAPNYFYPAMLNKWFGTKIKVVVGFKGGTDIFLAMERGEVEGRCDPQLTAIKLFRSHWLPEHKVKVPILISDKRSAEFPDTPTILEFAKDELTRQRLRLFFITQDMHRPFLLPPGVPDERVREVREAFEATLADAAFRADAARMNLPLDPVSGDDVARVLASGYALPVEIVQAVKEIVGEM